MARTLRFLPQKTQHPAFNVVESRMSGLGDKDGGGSSPPFRLNLANSAWGQEGFRFEQAYLETLARQYGTGLRSVDFAQPDEASEQINAWNETEGRIEDLVSPDIVSPSTGLVLANAVYFKASWLSSFQKSRTQQGPFTPPDGGSVIVPLMRQTSYLPYAEGEGYQAVQLPYKGGAADMLVVLSEEGRFGEIEDRSDAGFLDEVDRNTRPDEFPGGHNGGRERYRGRRGHRTRYADEQTSAAGRDDDGSPLPLRHHGAGDGYGSVPRARASGA